MFTKFNDELARLTVLPKWHYLAVSLALKYCTFAFDMDIITKLTSLACYGQKNW